MFCGGMLALLALQGAAIHYLCATRGEGGEVGEPPVGTRNQLGAIREAEMRCAVQTLGGAGVEFLDYVDPLVGEDEELHPYTDDMDGLITNIQKHMRRLQPDVVITHGSSGEYGHPAHIQLHQAVLRSVRTHDLPVTVYSIAADVPTIKDRLWNESDPAHIAIDISPWAEAKIAAMTCNRTQHALFKRRRKLTHIRQALRATESVHQHYPVLVDGA